MDLPHPTEISLWFTAQSARLLQTCIHGSDSCETFVVSATELGRKDVYTLFPLTPSSARQMYNEAILQLVQLGWIISDGAPSHDSYLNEEGVCQEAQAERETLARAACGPPQTKK